MTNSAFRNLKAQSLKLKRNPKVQDTNGRIQVIRSGLIFLTTADSRISRMERGQPCPRGSIISPKQRADKAVRALPAHLSLDNQARQLSQDTSRLFEMARGPQAVPRRHCRPDTARGGVSGGERRQSAGAESKKELPAGPRQSRA